MLHVVTAPTAYPFQIIEIVLGASLMPSTVLLVKEGMLPAEAIKALRDLFAGCTIFRTPSCPAVDDTQAA